MKKTKLNERFEKAFNAFFENESQHQPNALAVLQNQELAQVSPSENLVQTADKYFDWFKKIFLFVPGVNILYFLTLFTTFVVVSNEFPLSINLGMIFYLIAGIFITMAGIGDWRKKEHLALPASVILVGTTLGTIFGLIQLYFPQFTKLLFNDNVPLFLYFMPLAFIAPILVKGWLESEKNS